MTAPTPLLIPWCGQPVRIRHDDPALQEYSPRAAKIGAAMSLASTPAGLQRALEYSVGEWYLVDVRDGPVVGLWRRPG